MDSMAYKNQVIADTPAVCFCTYIMCNWSSVVKGKITAQIFVM